MGTAGPLPAAPRSPSVSFPIRGSVRPVKKRGNPSRRAGRLCTGAAAILLSAGLALAQNRPQPAGGERIEPSPALIELLDAPYLSDTERRDLRVRHGLWKEGDLDTPALAAMAALVRGAYD